MYKRIFETYFECPVGAYVLRIPQACWIARQTHSLPVLLSIAQMSCFFFFIFIFYYTSSASALASASVSGSGSSSYYHYHYYYSSSFLHLQLTPCVKRECVTATRHHECNK